MTPEQEAVLDWSFAFHTLVFYMKDCVHEHVDRECCDLERKLEGEEIRRSDYTKEMNALIDKRKKADCIADVFQAHATSALLQGLRDAGYEDAETRVAIMKAAIKNTIEVYERFKGKPHNVHPVLKLLPPHQKTIFAVESLIENGVDDRLGVFAETLSQEDHRAVGMALEKAISEKMAAVAIY